MDIASKMNKNNVMLFVAELADRKEIVGYIVAFICSPSTGYVDEIAVHPSYRGNGIGTALLRYVEQVMFHNKVKYVELSVKSGDIAALNFYLKRGYRITGSTLNLTADLSKIKIQGDVDGIEIHDYNVSGKLHRHLKPLVWWNKLMRRMLKSLNSRLNKKCFAVFENGVLSCYIECYIEGYELYVDYAAVRDANDPADIEGLISAISMLAKKLGLREICISIDSQFNRAVQLFLDEGFRVYEVEFRVRKILSGSS